MTAANTAALIEAAESAALTITKAAACNPDHVYPVDVADDYGLAVEVLIGDEWERLDWVESESRDAVEAVRLYDRDGERSEECRTVAEVEAARDQWLALLGR